jgi:hypothetical protein
LQLLQQQPVHGRQPELLLLLLALAVEKVGGHHAVVLLQIW